MGAPLNDRVITKSFRKHYPPYSQELIQAPFARSFVIMTARDQEGRPADIQWQLNTAGEPLREFTPMREGMNIFVAEGFNQIWVRNRSSKYVDVVVLVSPDVIETSGVQPYGWAGAGDGQTVESLPSRESLTQLIQNGGTVDLSSLNMKNPIFRVVLDNTTLLPNPVPLYGIVRNHATGAPLNTAFGVSVDHASGAIQYTQQVYNFHYSILVDKPLQHRYHGMEQRGKVPSFPYQESEGGDWHPATWNHEAYYGPYASQLNLGDYDEHLVLAGIVATLVNGERQLDEYNQPFLLPGDVIDVYSYYNWKFSANTPTHLYDWDMTGIEFSHDWKFSGGVSYDETAFYPM